MVLVYMILCALYESVFIPFAVLLAVPCGLMGSFLFAWLFGLENNIYMQTGLIMIIGLLAKTAILLTEYAGKRRSEGMTLAQAAYSAAKVRLLPHPDDRVVYGVRPYPADAGSRSGCQR